MFSHIQIGARDLATMIDFYDAVLTVNNGMKHCCA
ncbi:hypothetical protein SAMN04490182_1325 [Pseudomonas cedrina]|uniref:Glyoxalase n=1 Tax=Pseudomonas cedrina TaxID=651740 RepID=A0ABY0UAE9_PSECE|nr:hypothetical protein SAMN04490182_1325 [Pseudomonas cedrina]